MSASYYNAVTDAVLQTQASALFQPLSTPLHPHLPGYLDFEEGHCEHNLCFDSKHIGFQQSQFSPHMFSCNGCRNTCVTLCQCTGWLFACKPHGSFAASSLQDKLWGMGHCRGHCAKQLDANVRVSFCHKWLQQVFFPVFPLRG